jgi:hypothetical protein
MTNEPQHWEEKYNKLVDDFYYDLKAYQLKTKELREEAESARMEAKGWKNEAKELRSALEDISEYLNFNVCSDSMTGDDYRQRIIVAIDHLTNHLKGTQTLTSVTSSVP